MNRRDLLKQALFAAAGTSVVNGALTTSAPGSSPLLQTPPNPVTLKAFRFEHLGVCCSATDAEAARLFFEETCYEVVSPKEVTELVGQELNQFHHFGVEVYPYSASRTFGMELEARMKEGLSEPDYFYDEITLPPLGFRYVASWTKCHGGEYTPPAGTLVWTTDDKTVRRGMWHPHEDCLFDFEGWLPGEWKDIFGDKIPHVTAWQEYRLDRDVPVRPFHF